MAKLLFFMLLITFLTKICVFSCVSEDKKQPNNKLLYKLILIFKNNLELEFLGSSSVLLTP